MPLEQNLADTLPYVYTVQRRRKFSQPQAYMHHFLHLCLLSVNGFIAHGACFVVQQLTRALCTNWSKSYSGLSDGLHGCKPLFLQFYWQQTRVCAGPW